MIKFLNYDNGFTVCDGWTPDCWVNVECPDKEDVRFLTEELHIPSDFLTDIADIDERSRVDHDDNWRLTILRIPLSTPNGSAPFSTVPIGIISAHNILVTICYHHTDVISDFIEYCRRREVCIARQSDFVLHIIYSSAYWYLEYLKQINRMVNEASIKLQKSIRNEDLLMLQSIQTTLVYFSTSIKGNEALIGRLQRVYDNDCDTDLLDDVKIDMQQADNTVNIYNDILESTLSSFASVISNNVNDIMKKMTSISVVLMIPTLIASFYGMNVAVPFGATHNIFWFIASASLLLSVCCFIVLRKIHWL